MRVCETASMQASVTVICAIASPNETEFSFVLNVRTFYTDCYL
ncbi:unnamed protein product [Ixodes pacificus]